MLPGYPAQPVHVVLSVFPGHAHHRMAVVLHKPEIAPGTDWVGFGFGPSGPDTALYSVASGSLREDRPFSASDVVLADSEPADMYFLSWPLIFISILLSCG